VNLIIVLIILLLLFGGFGYNGGWHQSYPVGFYGGFSTLVIILLVLVVLRFLGLV
jgi:hypothetical protein